MTVDNRPPNFGTPTNFDYTQPNKAGREAYTDLLLRHREGEKLVASRITIEPY